MVNGAGIGRDVADRQMPLIRLQWGTKPYRKDSEAIGNRAFQPIILKPEGQHDMFSKIAATFFDRLHSLAVHPRNRHSRRIRGNVLGRCFEKNERKRRGRADRRCLARRRGGQLHRSQGGRSAETVSLPMRNTFRPCFATRTVTGPAYPSSSSTSLSIQSGPKPEAPGFLSPDAICCGLNSTVKS